MNQKNKDLNEELQKLIKEKTFVKIEQMKMIDTLKDEFQREKEKLKLTFE